MPWKHFHVRLSVTEHARGPCHGTVKPGYKGTGYKGYLAMKVQTQVQIFFLGGGGGGFYIFKGNLAIRVTRFF
jgi:hypothetical protein